MEKKKIAGGIWCAAWPLLVYWFLSAVLIAFVAIPLGLSMMESTLLGNLICTAIYWLLYRKDRSRSTKISERRYIPLEGYVLVWAVSGTAALAFLSNQFLNLVNLAELSDRYQSISRALELEDTKILLLGTVVLAPIAEEILMRGVLYGRLRRIMSAGAAIFVSALLFGIMHGNLVQAVHAFLIGAFLAWLMECFGNILVPILGHMAANLASGFILAGRNRIEYLFTLLVCAACVGRTVQILREWKRRAEGEF